MSKNSSSDVNAPENNDTVSDSRRKAIKTAGVAGGLAAGATWKKPLVQGSVLPAHAEMSERLLTGPASGLEPLAHNLQGKGETRFAQKALQSVIPKAEAAGNSFDPAEYLGVDDLRHCVTMSFPSGPGPNQPFAISVTGPSVYYAYSAGNCSPAEIPWSLTGNGGGTLGGPEGKDFEVVIGNVRVKGCITDDDFLEAQGSVVWENSGFGSLESSYAYGANDDARFFVFIEYGYGASFTITQGGGCSIGSGNFDSVDGYFGDFDCGG